MNQLEKTLTSLEVAEMVDRQHSEVLKDIRRIERQLPEGKMHLGDYFIESVYKDSNNQQRPQFLLTKKGCELYATRMTGEKGTQFAVSYIERFNQMEKELSKPTSHLEALQLTVQELTSQDKRITNLEENMRINSGQEFHLREKGKKKVLKSLGGYGSPAYREMSGKVFARFWRDFKQHFVIPRYSDLPKVKFDEGVNFIRAWQPDTSTRLEIESHNRQQVIREVI